MCDGKPVDSRLVQALVGALNASALGKPEAANLGITQEWLNAHVGSQRPRGFAQGIDTTAGQKKLFADSFTNLEFISGVVPRLFSYSRTDDYPEVSVAVDFETGTRLTAESSSYYVFMLPWTLNGQKTENYNADISRAVAALMSPKTVNKERINGQGLLDELTEQLMFSIESEWNLRGTQDLAGNALNLLRQTYQVEDAEINPWHHPEYGTETYMHEPEEMNLHVTLRKSSFPPGVSDQVVLKYVNGKVQGVSEFLRTIGKYEQLALSVPWLNDYIAKNPHATVRITYVHDMSFGDKAMRTFTGDMKKRERLDLVEKVRAEQSEIVLLMTGRTYGESYWLLFPDKHVLLWRYDSGPSGLLKWTTKDFPPGECADYETNNGGCSGREVAPDGLLMADRAPKDEACVQRYFSTHQAASTDADDLFPVTEQDLDGFIDQTGKIVVPTCFDGVGRFSEALAPFERDGSWGFLYASGKVAIEPQFAWAEPFSEGLAQVQVSGEALGYDAKWAFIDKTGRVVIPPESTDSAYSIRNGEDGGLEKAFHEGLAGVERDGKIGYIDRLGRLVISAEFKYASPFSEGVAAVTKSESGDDGWGFIDKAGKWVIPPTFEWANSFCQGLASVNRTHDCEFIDLSGRVALKPALPPTEKDCWSISGDFSEGLARWKFGNKYGFIDQSGKTVIKPRFDLVGEFSEGLAAVEVARKWGYINKLGKIVIEPRALTSADAFHRGLARVVIKRGGYGYIDRTGKFIWKSEDE